MSAFKFIAAVALCTLLASPAFSQEVIPPTTAAAKPAAASKAGTPDKTFGAWKMACMKGSCVLTQRVMLPGKGGKETPGLLAFAGSSKEKTKDGKVVTIPHVRLVTPLGSFLPKGVGYKLDEGKEGLTPFLFCEPRGCMTELTLNAEMLGKLKAGKKLQVSYNVLDSKAPRKVNLSLNGFAQGMDAIAKN